MACEPALLTWKEDSALGCAWQIKLVGKKRRKNLFSRSADAQVKRMRKWFWSRWPIHQTRPNRRTQPNRYSDDSGLGRPENRHRQMEPGVAINPFCPPQHPCGRHGDDEIGTLARIVYLQRQDGCQGFSRQKRRRSR
jgi:hypothetical protein